MMVIKILLIENACKHSNKPQLNLQVIMKSYMIKYIDKQETNQIPRINKIKNNSADRINQIFCIEHKTQEPLMINNCLNYYRINNKV